MMKVDFLFKLEYKVKLNTGISYMLEIYRYGKVHVTDANMLIKTNGDADTHIV